MNTSNTSNNNLKGLRILIVEDDEINRKTICKIMERTGHSVSVAEDGSQALEILEREYFDCILMDIQMPVMDGIQATRAIRDSPRYRGNGQVAIIALTGCATYGDRERFLAAGMDAYMGKPFRRVDLNNLIQQTVQARRDTHSQNEFDEVQG